MSRILVSRATVSVSLAIVLGILVADLAGLTNGFVASAQTTCGSSQQLRVVAISEGTIVGERITAKNVLVNGTLVSGVFLNSVRVSGSMLYSGDVVGVQGVFPGVDSTCVSGVFPGVDVTGSVSTGDGPSVMGVFPGVDASVSGVFPGVDVISVQGVFPGVDVAGGEVQGNNVQVIDGVITGTDLVVFGAVISGGTSSTSVSATSITATPMR